jgi:alkanesulfonate monooxygenase SsuD/methylene tetrahydromethanopterin reductase-like flavin-dependent oxidoreductase (luciferase family)
VQFGLNLINFGPSASAAAIRSTVLWAEAQGFHLAMLSDHVTITPDVRRQYPEPFYEPFTTIAWLAGATSRITLGTTVVVVPYRHPLLVARMTAHLNEFTGGRLILGVGVGWARAEFEALGVPFERRGRLTDAYLAAIRPPHPPVWVGGASPAAIRRAGRYGDAWHPLNARLDWLATVGLPMLRAEAERVQRQVPAFAPRIKLRLVEQPLDDSNRRPGQGTLDQVRRDLAALAELGAEYVVLDTYLGNPAELGDPAAMVRPVEVLLEHAIDPVRQRLR